MIIWPGRPPKSNAVKAHQTFRLDGLIVRIVERRNAEHIGQITKSAAVEKHK